MDAVKFTEESSIIMLPHCSKCGALIKEVELVEDLGYINPIMPERCPRCQSSFSVIKIPNRFPIKVKSMIDPGMHYWNPDVLINISNDDDLTEMNDALYRLADYADRQKDLKARHIALTLRRAIEDSFILE